MSEGKSAPTARPRVGAYYRRNQKDRGANLVEFALLAPFLILLLLGIVEFGYFLGEWNTVKHGAHEGARLAAVNDSALEANTCNAMNLHGPGTTVTVDFTDGASEAIGDQASVTVTATNISSLSGVGLIEVFLPASISATADFRLEQPSLDWDDVTVNC